MPVAVRRDVSVEASEPTPLTVLTEVPEQAGPRPLPFAPTYSPGPEPRRPFRSANPPLGRTRHIIAISGKDSLTTALVQRERAPDLPYEYIFADVELELPEVYAWLAKVEKYLGAPLIRVGTPLESLMRRYSMLPSHLKRFCTGEGKIEPQIKYFGEEDEIVQYIGIRADEGRRIINITGDMPDNITTVYPLVEEGVDINGVYDRLTAIDMLPPLFFWQRLYDAVYAKASSSTRKFIDSLSPWRTSTLFSWRSRSNCSCCFYQALHEWVGLLEFHPDLFEQAVAFEEAYGCASPTSKSKHDYTFRPEMPLRRVRERAPAIFESRVEAVYKAALAMRSDADAGRIDLLATTSCGAFCGK